MSPVVDVDGARDDLPPGTGITGIRSRHQIKLTAQIVFNPKFPFPLSDFTVQVSLTALQLKWSADSKPVGTRQYSFDNMYVCMVSRCCVCKCVCRRCTD